MVTSWILNSLSKKIADNVIYSRTVRELWMSLEHRFGQSNGAKLYHLQKELNKLIQGTSNIAGYFTKLKRLWDELDSLNTNVKCNCDENQRESYVNSTVNPDSSAFMVGNSHQYRVSKQGQRFMASSSKFGNVYPRPAPTGSQQTQLQGFPKQNQNPKFKGKKTKYNPNVTCTYCGKTGHVELNCFRLIGFPDDFQFTHEKGFNNQVKGNGDQIRGNGVMTMEETDNKQNFG
ncbi:uncharacterized protein LOC125838886 [Solanum verrucosum]|uniref:uncharacterized protein LOC125838886 n=1 Tax=Solanum verrucosum TaxID=315347 RepID=UPI0020D1082A|nr:uncharacterized protein LOC125838886 [Solanum verrucosum]